VTKSKSGYPVEFVDDLFGDSPVLARVLKEVSGAESPRIVLVADINVVQRTEGLGTKIGRYVNAHGITLAGNPVVLGGGEKIKSDSLQSAFQVISAILEANLSCSDCVVAMGGGAVLDVAGYAAAQVRGGVNIVRIPTTPAAMIDAAFADYAAINSRNVKDALRVRSVPSAVLIDLSFAATVLDGVWRGGVSEAVRLALVADASLFKKLAKLLPEYGNRSAEALSEIVRGAVATRMRKGGVDFAQWCAVRLEAMSGYKLPHGYAVSIGICMDMAYAVEKGYLKEKDRDLVVELLRGCGALDGLPHSRHLLGQTEVLLLGLDAWCLSVREPSMQYPAGLGKMKVEEKPDLDVYRKVLNDFVSVATGA